VTSALLKLAKIREFYEIFKIRKHSHKFVLSHGNCKVFEFAQQLALAVDYTEASVECEQWAVMN